MKAKYAPPREGDIRDSQADITRARDVLGYIPRIGFEEGLNQTWEWFRTSHSATSHAQRRELYTSTIAFTLTKKALVLLKEGTNN